MKKLEISKLNKTQLLKILEKNSKLKNDVIEDFEESQMIYISEILEYFKTSLNNWSIGFYNNNFIEIKDNYNFLNDFDNMNNDFSILKEVDVKILHDVIDKICILDSMNYDNKNYILLEKWIDTKVEYFKNELLLYFSDLTGYNDDVIENYFYEFYIETRLDQELFIDKNNIIYENILKSYK